MFLHTLPSSVLAGILVLAGIGGLALLSKWNQSSTNAFSPRMISLVRRSMRAATGWNTSAQQDKQPLMAMLHNSHAKAYLQFMRRMVNDSDLARLTSVDPREFANVLDDREARLLQFIGETCPSLHLGNRFVVAGT